MIGDAYTTGFGARVGLGRLGDQVDSAVPAPALDVEAGGDAFDPGLKRPLAPELGDLFEGGEEGDSKVKGFNTENAE